MLDAWIETLKKGECIKEHELKRLCALVSTPPTISLSYSPRRCRHDLRPLTMTIR